MIPQNGKNDGRETFMEKEEEEILPQNFPFFPKIRQKVQTIYTL